MIDLHLTAEQELLRDTTQQFLRRTADSRRLREMAEHDEGLDRSWWCSCAELGWTTLLVPDALGGGSVSGSGLLDLAVTAEVIGQHVAPGPFIPVNSLITAIVESPRREQYRALLDAFIDGTAVGTWAAHEPANEWAPTRPRTRARRDGDRFRLTGVKDRVEYGAQADHFLVGAELDGRLAQFVVPAGIPGLAIEPVWSLDLTRPFATVALHGVVVPASAMVTPPETALAAVERQCQIQLVLQAAETAGATQAVFDQTLRWVFDRYAFGRPLASYQAIKHRMGDAVTQINAMHATVRGAVDAVEERTSVADRLARVASIFTHTHAAEVIQECIQFHGGIGVTWEHDLHLYLRRVTVNRAHYGTPEELRRSLCLSLAV